MKWLSGGLTFVNFATISGLLIGMLTGGLSTPVAFAALILAAAFALFAYLRTSDPKSEADALDRDTSKASKFRNLPPFSPSVHFAGCFLSMELNSRFNLR